MDDFLGKPIRSTALWDTINRLAPRASRPRRRRRRRRHRHRRRRRRRRARAAMPLAPNTANARVLFLDIDGVLNRTGYRPTRSLGLRSWIEPELAAHLNEVVRITDARIVLSSDWRINRNVHALQAELAAAGIVGALLDATPVLTGAPRWREIETWMQQHDASLAHIAIVDDTFDMGPLSARFVRVSPLNGLNDESAAALIALFTS